MRRRRFVSLVGVGLLGGIAGCSQGSEENEPEPVRVVKFDIKNNDDVSHDGHVTLFRDGTTVFQDAWSVTGERKYSATDVWMIHPPAFDPVLGDWSIRMRMEDDEQSHRFDPNSLQGKENCVWPSIYIMDDGDLAFAMNFGIESCPPEAITKNLVERGVSSDFGSTR